MPKTLGTRKEHLNSDEGGRTMSKTLGIRWLVVAAGAAMLLVLGAACTKEIEVPGETIIVEKEVVKTVEVPGETIVVEKEVVKTVEVPGETIVVEKEVVKEVIKTVAGPERVVVREVPGKNYVTDPVFGNVVPAPQYGGTLTFAMKHDWDVYDTYLSPATLSVGSVVIEKLVIIDWAIDRDTYPFVGGYQAPVSALRGALAESWEQPDELTYVFKIRQGVKWHDKAPMNGRELTADDIVFNYHRDLGLGSGFTEPSPFTGLLGALPWESIEATDKWTVVMKLKEPTFAALGAILDGYYSIQPPEVIEEHGDISDWRQMVGTGPYMITDWVVRSSVTYTKNPDYWSYDEKYPENRLPYIDEVRGLVMPEVATFLAALRTGKIDYIGWQGGSQINALDQAESLRRTNPELVIHTWSERSNNVAWLNVSKPPYDDIMVRHAMQMALDLETINSTYYKGYADTIPRGRVGREFKEYTVLFEEWPDELKGYYTYDVAGAEKLLDEAGYPRGADGIRFKTTYMHPEGKDLSWAELIASYWREIGVHVDIEVVTGPEQVAIQKTGDFAMTQWLGGVKAFPPGQMEHFTSGWVRNAVIRDAQYDASYEAMLAATTVEEQMSAVKDMDMRSIEQHWMIWGLWPQRLTCTRRG